MNQPSENPYVLVIERETWGGTAPSDIIRSTVEALERGLVIFLPNLRFAIDPAESTLFSPAIAGAKNVSYQPETGRIGGAAVPQEDIPRLQTLLGRFSRAASALVDDLLPGYRGHLRQGRASFRPAEIAGRATSWRKDDTRLHIDSFPSTPVHGRRILRVFTNVNPSGRPRSWRISSDFEQVAGRYAGGLRIPPPGVALLLRLLRITKTRRSAYDGLMLQLHDRMKADQEYQTTAPQVSVEFPAGSTWVAFTDQVSHAAMAGQYQLEQTFLLPVDAMLHPERAPLRVLERLKRRRLA
jgi:hypothetical protein